MKVIIAQAQFHIHDWFTKNKLIEQAFNIRLFNKLLLILINHSRFNKTYMYLKFVYAQI